MHIFPGEFTVIRPMKDASTCYRVYTFRCVDRVSCGSRRLYWFVEVGGFGIPALKLRSGEVNWDRRELVSAPKQVFVGLRSVTFGDGGIIARIV